MHRGEWTSSGPTCEEDIQELIRRAPIELPRQYLNFLKESDGAGGDIPVQPWFIYFWKASLVHEQNEGYEVALNVPGFYAFATSGGGEMFAFDARKSKPWPIVIIPFIGMQAEEALPVAPDFASFRKMFGLSSEPELPEIRLDDAGHSIDGKV